MAVTERRSAEERREQILERPWPSSPLMGFEGGSTEAIARAVGISQPYVFRLFGTKKELFIATIERCMSETLEMFRTAWPAEGRGRAARNRRGRTASAWAPIRPISAPDAGLRGVRTTPRSVRSCVPVTASSSSTSSVSRACRRTRLPLLRQGDAPERHRLAGPPRRRRGLGQASRRGLPRGRLGLFFST